MALASPTRLWLLRHALVERTARAVLYGTADVTLCGETLAAQAGIYRSLARHLPQPAHWVITQLARTRATAQAIFEAGYPAQPLTVEPDLAEQALGDWQGIAHADLPPHLSMAAHPFWPVAASELPPGGESLDAVLRRVGPALERLAARWPASDIIAISHGGAIRCALAHALGVGSATALHFAVQNISVSRLERHPAGWRVVSVNVAVGSDGAFAAAA